MLHENKRRTKRRATPLQGGKVFYLGMKGCRNRRVVIFLFINIYKHALLLDNEDSVKLGCGSNFLEFHSWSWIQV